MERAIGEVFDFKGVKLQVKYTGDNLSCCGCYFYEAERTCNTVDYKNQAGACFRIDRTDNKHVIFVEVRDDKEKEYQQ